VSLTTLPAVANRFALWVDGVGGYLVCLSDTLSIGKAGFEQAIDIPIQADLSRKHAIIRRYLGNYFLEPIALVTKNGRKTTNAVALQDGDEFQLGQAVQLRFRQPHALSATARLELISQHRFPTGFNAVLLMSESCVLGPVWQNHVTCRLWQHDLILARQGKQLICRTMQQFNIDGHECDGTGLLQPNSRITGNDFCVTLEPVQ
jgi:FHA domain